jgi:hypothetical protein
MNIFTKHPNEVGETYCQHFCFAAKTGFSLLFAGTCCLIHSILPFLFTRTASTIVKGIYNRLANRKTSQIPENEIHDWMI